MSVQLYSITNTSFSGIQWNSVESSGIYYFWGGGGMNKCTLSAAVHLYLKWLHCLKISTCQGMDTFLSRPLRGAVHALPTSTNIFTFRISRDGEFNSTRALPIPWKLTLRLFVLSPLSCCAAGLPLRPSIKKADYGRACHTVAQTSSTGWHQPVERSQGTAAWTPIGLAHHATVQLHRVTSTCSFWASIHQCSFSFLSTHSIGIPREFRHGTIHLAALCACTLCFHVQN